VRVIRGDQTPATRPRRTGAGSLLASGAGAVAGGAFAVVARVRRADKPLHPIGDVEIGRLLRHGHDAAPTGSAFLDEPGDDEVLVRRSRSVGLPDPWPDVNGLAVRVPRADGGVGDLLLSGTGRGTITRFVLAPQLRHGAGHVGTLVPYRSPTGAVHVGARAVTPEHHVLAWARPGEGWHDFAELRLADEPGLDLAISFDAILHACEGLEPYDWYRRLRLPAYDAARRLRGVRQV